MFKRFFCSLKVSLLFLLLVNSAQAITNVDNGKPILQLNSQGHTSPISSMVFTKDSKQLVTGAFDKKIIVWDVSTGKPLRTIRGQIGAGIDGAIGAFSLSSNNQWLAVSSLSDKVRVYNFQTGQIEHVFSISGKSTNLSFSPNGKQLAIIDSTMKILLFDVETGQKLRVFSGFTNFISKVAFSPDGKQLVASSFDKTLRLWQLSTGKLIGVMAAHTDKVLAADFTPDNKYIVSGSHDKSLILWNAMNGRYIKHIVKTALPIELFNISNDGSIVNVVSREESNVYTIKTGQLITNFTEHDQTINASTFSPTSDLIATSGGTRHSIHLWHAKTGKRVMQMNGVGSTICCVGSSSDYIGWGKWEESSSSKQSAESRGDIAYQLNINNPVLDKINTSFAWNRGIIKTGQFVLTIEDSQRTIRVKKGSKTQLRLPLEFPHSFSSATLTPNGERLIAAAGFGGLFVYDTNNRKLVHNLVGHSGEIMGLTVSADNKLLISGSTDQTVRVWSLESGENLLTVFHSKDDEWIAWTPEGFFDASAKGANYIGYHVNRGFDKAADFIAVEQLYSNFYRPDLVQKKIEGENISQFANKININQIIEEGLPPTISFVAEQTSFDTSQRDYSLQFQLCDQGGGIGKIQLRINDIVIGRSAGERALKRKNSSVINNVCQTYNQLISLQAGENKISLSAFNKTNNIESLPVSLNLKYKGESQKPNLHIVAIAIDSYRDGDLRLNYSQKDARAIVDNFQVGSKSLFDNIFQYTIFDDQVRRQQVSDVFDEVSKKAKPEDVFVLYIAGHGVTNKTDGNYYFLPVNFRYTSESAVIEQGLSNDFFQQNLAKISAQKSLVLLDTCNSGAFSTIRTRGIEEKTAVSRLVKATGRATIMASSRDQVALEGYQGHGAFTWTLLEAMKGKAYGIDNKITINELADYVEETLPELTYKTFGYEQVPQRSLQGMNFPLAIRESK